MSIDPSIGGRILVRWMALLSFAVLLAACSSIRLGYNNADTLLNFTLSSSFDLDDAQKALASDRTSALLEWHRTTQLPLYIKLLGRIKARLVEADAGRPLAQSDILGMQREINAALRVVGEKAAPDLAALALTLTPAQVDYFEQKLAKDAAKARAEAARGVTSLDTRVDKYVSSLENWMGSVSGSQIAAVRQIMANGPNVNTMWLDERERRDRDLVALLRGVVAEKPAPAVVTRRLRQYFAELDAPTDPVRAANVGKRRELNAQLIAEVLNRGGPEQRQAAQRKAQAYIDDLSSLLVPAG